jgi:hypothetical protein
LLQDFLFLSILTKNRPSVCAFRPNWRETAARSSSLRRTLQAFLSKAFIASSNY